VGLLGDGGHEVTQVGAAGEEQVAGKFVANPSFQELGRLLLDQDSFITIDSYLQHYAWFLGKCGIVVWGQSDPAIFGHGLHVNLLKDEKYLRPDPFNIWEGRAVIEEAFVRPEIVVQALAALS
jgi:ADP-heptose:LPS heptosyltransferase